MVKRMKDDVEMIFEQDSTARTTSEAITTYADLHAVWSHLIAHKLYNKKHYVLARMISQVSRFFTGIEIHPEAKTGKCLSIDHGTGVAIGGTCTIGGNVTICQGVTLGGTGKQKGECHPDIGDNALIAAGSKVLGNIQTDPNANIGISSIVLQSVPSYTTVVGIPGHITRQEGKRTGKTFDHRNLPDPLLEQTEQLEQ